MSSTPSPVTAATRPFEPTTTPAIERSNRLMSVRQNPGYVELVRIANEMAQEAVEANTTYPGYDTQVMWVLKIRQQVAAEYVQMFFSRVQSEIQAGVDDMNAQINNLPAKTAAEAIDQGDYVRQAVLQKFNEYDSRAPGSY